MIKTNNKKLLGVLVASTLALGIAVPTISNGLSGSHGVIVVAKDKKDDSKKSESLKELEKKLAKLQAEQKELKGVKDAFAKIGEIKPKRDRLYNGVDALAKKIATYELGQQTYYINKDASTPDGTFEAIAKIPTKLDKNGRIEGIKQSEVNAKINKVDSYINTLKAVNQKEFTDAQKDVNKKTLEALHTYKGKIVNGRTLGTQRADLQKMDIELKKYNSITKGKDLKKIDSDLAKVEKEIKEVEGKIADLKGKKPTESPTPTTPGNGKDDGGKDDNKDKDGDKDKKGDNCVGGNCQKQHQHQTVNNYGGGNGGNGNYNAGGGRAPVAGGNYANGLPRLPKTGTSTGIVASSLGALLASGFGLRYFVRRFNKNS